MLLKDSLLLSPLRVSHLVFCCCETAPWPGQFIEGRVYFGYVVLVLEGPESVVIIVGRHGTKHQSMEAETAGSLHLELQETQKCKWRDSFETSKPTPMGVLPLATAHHLSLAKQEPPTGARG